MKNNFGRGLLLATIFASCFFVASKALAADKVYISQVQISGNKSTDDFVELYNPGSSPFNLKGYRLVKRTASGSADASIKSWTADEFIPAGGYYLWANSGFADIGITPNATTTASIADNNGIAIRQGSNDTGTIIDSVAWGTTSNAFANVSATNPAAGQSLQRADLNNDSSVFVISSSSPHASTAAGGGNGSGNSNNTAQTTGLGDNSQAVTTPGVSSTVDTVNNDSFFKATDIKISEIFANPPGDDSGQEAIELENTGVNTVSLNGWWIADKGGLKSNSYQIQNTSIQPGQFLVITIPPKYFSLNNTGGDTVNLYYADKTLADSAGFADDAKENVSYQKFQGSWVWVPPTLGSKNFGVVKNSLGQWAVRINELLSNPIGSNEGKQWVELYNASSEAIDLKGFMLDSGNAVSVSSNRIVLDEKAVLPAQGYYVVTIPEDGFTLSVKKQDQVRLFDPSGMLVESIAYENAPEGKSYFKDSMGKWQYGLPTPGSENKTVTEDYRITISEILPNPSEDQEEFLELRNDGDKDVDVKGMVIFMGGKNHTLDSLSVPAKGFAALYENDLPARLRNAGDTLKLIDVYGRELSVVTYGKAVSGQAYARVGEGFAWTTLSTPGEENQMVLAAQTEESSIESKKQTEPKKAATDKTTASDNVSAKLYRESLKVNESLQKSVDALEVRVRQLQESVQSLAQITVAVPKAQAVEASAETGNKKSSFVYLIVALGAFVMLTGLFFWKNPFKQMQ